MAYIDILSQENYIQVNTKAIHLFGRDTALYLSVLLDIYSQVKRKKTYNKEGFWPLDRSYVREKTCLAVPEQRACDTILNTAGVLETDEDNLRIDAQLLASLLTAEDTSLLKTITKVSKAESKEGKAQAKRESAIIGFKVMCEKLAGENHELAVALDDWVEAVYARETSAFLSKPLVNTFYNKITSYSSDIKDQIEVVKLCITNSWKDADWAINKISKSSAARTNSVDLNAPVRY